MGAFGAAATVVGDLVVLSGSTAGSNLTWLSIVSNVAIGTWLIVAGTILGRDDAFRRIGWMGQLGGAGTLLFVLSFIPLPIPSQSAAGPGLYDYARILGLFGIVFLVRVWRFAALGKLPGPGLI